MKCTKCKKDREDFKGDKCKICVEVYKIVPWDPGLEKNKELYMTIANIVSEQFSIQRTTALLLEVFYHMKLDKDKRIEKYKDVRG